MKAYVDVRMSLALHMFGLYDTYFCWSELIPAPSLLLLIWFYFQTSFLLLQQVKLEASFFLFTLHFLWQVFCKNYEINRLLSLASAIPTRCLQVISNRARLRAGILNDPIYFFVSIFVSLFIYIFAYLIIYLLS